MIQSPNGKKEGLQIRTFGVLHGAVRNKWPSNLTFFLCFMGNRMFLACSYVFPSIKSEYFGPDLAGGIGFSASPSEFYKNHSPMQAFIRTSELGWRPISDEVGSWLAVHLEDQPLFVIATVIFPCVVDGVKSWVTSFKIEFTNTSDFNGKWHKWTHSYSGSEIFPGLAREAEKSRFHNLEPLMANFVRILPQVWHNALALKWELVFCHRN